MEGVEFERLVGLVQDAEYKASMKKAGRASKPKTQLNRNSNTPSRGLWPTVITVQTSTRNWGTSVGFVIQSIGQAKVLLQPQTKLLECSLIGRDKSGVHGSVIF